MANHLAPWYARMPIRLRFGVPAVVVVFTTLFAAWGIVYYSRAAYQYIEEDALERITADLTVFQRTLEFLYASGAERQVQREMVNRIGHGEVQERFVIDEHDWVIAASREAVIGMPLPEALARLGVHEPVSGFAARLAEVRRRLAGQAFLTAGGAQVAGLVPVILGMKPGELRPNRVGILFENRDLAFAKALPNHEVRQRTLLLGSVVVIFALLLALLLHYYITRRVGKLVRAAQRFAQGELHARSGLGGRDEISEAGAAFDAMAERVGAEMRMRKKAQESLAASETRMRAILDATTDCVITIDHEGRIVEFNPAAERTFGYRRVEVMGQPMAELLIPAPLRAAHYQGLRRYLESGTGPILNRTIEFQALRADGTEFPTELMVTRIGIAGPPLFTAYMRDITERKEADDRARVHEAQIHRLAYFDSMTEIPNRALLLDRLGQTLAQSERDGTQVAVLFTDLDRFKTINDTLGHPAGDELLRQAAARLRTVLREGDTVARLGGDEFVILLPRCSTARDAAQVAAKALGTLSVPFTVSGHELHVTTSLGVSLFPKDGADAETLLKHADIALYQAKDRGRNQYQFFDARMNTHAHERLLLENSMRRAVERGELALYYQPQIDLRSNTVTGVEALLRWQHPERGVLLPAEFIAIAEDTGLIVEIGAWVLREACRQAVAWQRAGLPLARMAVNLSVRQILRQVGLPVLVKSVLRETGLIASGLELEIMESVLMAEREHSIKVLQELYGMGVQLTVDDFGTGYSSLAYLKRLPLDRIKIDRSFVRDIPGDADDAAIVQTILAMAKQLQIGVVAEGVETRAQYEFLREHQCEEGQGYLFSEPLPARACAEFLAARPLSMIASR